MTNGMLWLCHALTHCLGLQIEMLSMAKVKQARSAELGQGYLDDAVAFVPMIAMLVIRSCEPHACDATCQFVSDAWHN